LIAQLDIDKIIQTIRNSPSRAEAKVRLQQIAVPAEMVARALGDQGFAMFVDEYGRQDEYNLSANQSEAIVSMQLGSLANLERENLQGEHAKLLDEIAEYLHLLSDIAHIRQEISEEMDALQQKYSSPRRTEISEEELTDVDKGELIAEEPMVVTLTQRGYVKRTPLSMYQAQNRGGKGIRGAKSDEEDPIQHLFVSSTHSWLLFFTNYGKVYWQKVYDLPLQNRTAKGRALVNLLNLSDGESVQDCVDVREFDDERGLLMATRKGIVKKTALSAYSRPMRGGIIAIKLDDDDRLVDVVKVGPGQDVIISTSSGMSIRFSEQDARAMGRNTRGVKGISLGKGGEVVGMVVAEEETTLLTVCQNGYGKRTPIGLAEVEAITEDAETGEDAESDDDETSPTSSSMRYRRQKRGGKGVIDIKTTKRNGPVIGILSVIDGDDILMITTTGKIQRVRAADISVIGRNTQGVRLMRLDEDDHIVALAKIPAEIVDEEPEVFTVDAPDSASAVAESVDAEGAISPESNATETDSNGSVNPDGSHIEDAEG
ncbi:MAG: DNA gyrase subunit A, partial [Planctomycetaceae bacterium]|nr:DNA gyrase subunit A [Planctomycetaceae bacterium]